MLQSLWPKQDWASYINDDRDDEVIQLLTNIYHDIRLSPRKKEPPLSDEQWHDAYTTSIAVLKAIFRKTKTIEQAKSINARFCERFGIEYAEISTLPLKKTFLYWAVSSKPLSALGMDALNVEAKAQVLQGNREDKPIQQVTESPGADKTESELIPIDAPTQPMPAPVSTPELSAAVEVTQESKTTNVKKGRFGPVFASKDMELDHFRLEFSLKQIVMSPDSTINTQSLLNQCYESLCDLSDALEMPRKWLGMNALILRIGHSGILDNEDKYQSITYSGEAIHPSIAHQWIKCLDARFATSIQPNMQTFDRYVSTMYQKELTGVHSDKIKAIYLIVKKITKNMSNFSNHKLQYFIDSVSFEVVHGRRPGTLTAMPEMFARSFDAHIEDRLATLSRTNHYLTADTLNQTLAAYPQDAERKELGQLFSALFHALKQPDSPNPNLTNQKNQ